MSTSSRDQHDSGDRGRVPPSLRVVQGGRGRNGYAYVQIDQPDYQTEFELQASSNGYLVMGPNELPAEDRVSFSLVVTDDLFLVNRLRLQDESIPMAKIYAVVPDDEQAIQNAEDAGADLAIIVPLEIWWGQ